MYTVPVAAAPLPPSRVWHVFWIIVIGLGGYGSDWWLSELTRPSPLTHQPTLPPFLAMVGALIATWTAPLVYGWRWAGLPLSLPRLLTIPGGPILLGITGEGWGQLIEALDLHRVSREITFLPLWLGLLLLLHLDIIVRTPVWRSRPSPRQE